MESTLRAEDVVFVIRIGVRRVSSADKYPIFYRTCASFITRYQSRPRSLSAHDEALESRMHAIRDWLKMDDIFHPAQPASKLCYLDDLSEPSPITCLSRVCSSRYPPNGELARRLHPAHAQSPTQPFLSRRACDETTTAGMKDQRTLSSMKSFECRQVFNCLERGLQNTC